MKYAALLVDLSKAFDTVYQAILLNKLSSIGLSSDTCSWFHDYLSDRTQATVIDGVKSEFHEVHKGVPQGSILEAVLFTSYMNTIGQAVKNGKLHLYADDTIMYAIALTVDLAVSKLLSDVIAMQESLAYVKRVLNTGKTKCIMFTH
jgi:hypothetical protein